MSELAEQATSAAEQTHRYDGGLAYGEPSDTHQVDRSHDRCVAYCLNPGQRRRGVRCPSCYQAVEIRSFGGDHIEPGGTRLAWWCGAFLAGWAVVFRDEVRPILAPRGHKTSTERSEDGPAAQLHDQDSSLPDRG